MFVTAVCFLFLLKLKWPKNKNIYGIVTSFCELHKNLLGAKKKNQTTPTKQDHGTYEGFNRPFPSSLAPLFQSESKCETILMKMTLICMKMKLHAELIFI